MPDVKISQLPAGTVTAASVLPAVNGGTTQKVTVQQILDIVGTVQGPKGDKGDKGDKGEPGVDAAAAFDASTPITHSSPEITTQADGQPIGLSADGLNFYQPYIVGAIPIIVNGKRFMLPLIEE